MTAIVRPSPSASVTRLHRTALRRGGRIDGIVHVAGEQHEVDVFVPHQRGELVDESRLFLHSASAFERTPEMPVGRMQYAHDYSFLRPLSKTI